MNPKSLKVVVWIGILVLCLAFTAWAQNPMLLQAAQKKAAEGGVEPTSVSQNLSAEQVDQIVAGLSDEQGRRLLIDELKAEALREAGDQAAGPPGGVAGIIVRIKDLTAKLQSRIEFLRSGGTSTPQQAGGIYALLGQGERGTKTVAGAILSVAAVLAGGLLVQWLFVRYTAAARRRITSAAPAGVMAKIGSLSSRALLDLVSIPVLIAVVVIFFFLFLDRTAGQRVPLAAYLTAVVCVQVAYVALRFFLAPRAPALRFLPFDDGTALYLHRWLLALAFVLTFNNVTVGVLSLAGTTELTRIKVLSVAGLIAAGMLIWMILQRRKEAAMAFCRGLPETSIRFRLARNWHHFAVFGVLLLLASAIFGAVLGTSSGQAILTLLMVAFYFMLDWILRSMLDAAFGLVERPHEEAAPAEASVGCDNREGNEQAEDTLPPADSGGLDLERMKAPLRTALRLSLAVLTGFWVLDIWHIALPIGAAVLGTMIKILMVVLVCYVAYGLVNAAILRRLRQEMPGDQDEEAEEGGCGRIAYRHPADAA